MTADSETGESNEPLRWRTVTYTDDKNSLVYAKGHLAGVHPTSEWTDINGTTRFRTWKFENVPAEEKDGAHIEIQPGGRTPVQYVAGETTFNEIPLRGRIIVLHLNNKGTCAAFRFDSSRRSDHSVMVEVTKGEVLCILAEKDQPDGKPAELLEYEEPGYTEDSLPDIKLGAQSIQGTSIPPEFWETLQILETGNIEDCNVPVIDFGQD